MPDRDRRYSSKRSKPNAYLDLKQSARRMRHEQTPAEDLLWQELRARKLAGSKWRRQHPVLTYIVDFYCAEHALVVEVDGPIHEGQADHDAARQLELESVGLRVLRFTNQEILGCLPEVLARVDDAVR